jgi:hypothetical protein
MKNEKRENDRQANSRASVTATVDAILFLEGLVKYLARNRNDVSHQLKFTHPGWEAVNTSSVETFVGGSLQLTDKDIPVKTAFGSSFLFTCTRGFDGEFHVMWSSSLS